MTQFVKDFVQDLTQDIKIRQCGTIVFNADNKSNVITVTLYNGTEPAKISGSVVGSVICSDGSTVPVTGGTISGNKVSVTLGGDCFAVEGPIGVGVQIVSGGVKTTVLKAIYNVELFTTDNVVDPGSRITITVSDLVQDIEEAVATIPAYYTDLMAAVAPQYVNITFPVKAGRYCWYNGKLYKAAVDINTSESWTAAHWTSAVFTTDVTNDLFELQENVTTLNDDVSGLTDDVTDLKSAFDGVMEADDTAEPVILEPTSTNYSATASATTMYISDRVIPAGSFISSIDIWARGAVKAVLINDRNTVVKIFDITEYGGLKSYKLNYYTSEDVRFGFVGLITFKGSITNVDEAIATTGLYESTNVAPAVGDVLTINRSSTNLYRFCVQWKYSVFGLIGDLNEKADKVGVYPDLTAGTASQILSKTTVEDQVPYTFRQTGGGQSVGDRATLDKIVGGTVAWNQIAQNNDAPSSRNGLTISGSTDSFTVNGTAEQTNVATGWFNLDNNSIIPLANHVLFYFYGLKSGSVSNADSTTFTPIAGYPTFKISIGQATVKKLPSTLSTTYGKSEWCCVQDTVFTNAVLYVQLFDLTQMFGATIADYIYSLETATAGAGVAWFRQLFPLDYCDYNPGELISVSGVSARETVGFNAWDGTYKAGYIISATTGEESGGFSTYGSTYYIPVIPDQDYYIKVTALNSSNNGLAWYDKEKVYISGNGYTGNVANDVGIKHSPKNAAYMRATLKIAELSTTAISLSSSLNGTYEPYQKHTYPLDASLTLRGIPKLDAQNRLYWDGDEYTPDGKVTRRYGVVDLGTLEWTKEEAIDYHPNWNTFYADPGNALGYRSINGTTQICSKYPSFNGIIWDDKVCGFGIASTNINISDSSLSDMTVSEFKAAMSGVYLVYELATPTTETAAEYQDIQIVDPYGTESFVTDGIVPVGHVTQYHENLREKIEQLPADFSTIIAPVEKTFVATRAYTSGALLIVNNVLYKATASIANGATITPGTNCTHTTLAAIIAALQ